MLQAESLDEVENLKNKGTHEDKIKRYKPHKSKAANRKFKLTQARTYFYENEASCEKNMETFLRSIEAVAGKKIIEREEMNYLKMRQKYKFQILRTEPDFLPSN